MKLKILLAGSAIFVSLAMTATPAAAQFTCDLNGVDGGVNATPADGGAVALLGTTTLACGPGAGATDPFSTAVGWETDAQFGSTAVGASAIANDALGTTINNIFLATPDTNGGSTAVGISAWAIGNGTLAVGDQAVVGLVTVGAVLTDIDPVQGGTAIGSLSLVTGANGTAVGQGATATAAGATALGGNNFGGDAFSARATNVDATALGADTLASGLAATAVGSQSVASGTASTALGHNSDATALGATAVGTSAQATANNTTALGRIANASVAGATAIGDAAIANGANSTALGTGASNATFANSVALGAGSVNTAANQVHVGGRTISGVTAGVAATDAVNVSQLTTATAGVATNTTAITALQTSDTTQNTAITAIQTVNTTQATQIGALQAADAGLDTRIDALEAVALDFDDDLDRLDDRASSGTATAIALSGMAFLPGKAFNLTANVGTYRGAHAGALQIGAMVGENVAVNAGIAHGFNKRGSTGARAGVTFGW